MTTADRVTTSDLGTYFATVARRDRSARARRSAARWLALDTDAQHEPDPYTRPTDAVAEQLRTVYASNLRTLGIPR